jgi:hypothetical protein
MAVTAKIEMNLQQIRDAVAAWAKAHNLNPDLATIELHAGRRGDADPGDPRGPGEPAHRITFKATIGGI